MALFQGSTRFMDGVMYVAVILVGSIFMANGFINGADLVAYLLYIQTLLTTIRRIVEFAEQFQKGTTGIERFFEIMDEPVTIKDKENPYYALKYERIAKRRGKKRAIIAIARMILTAIYSMLCTGEIWNPVDLYKIDMPEHLKEQQLAKAIKQATRFLEKHGLSVA